MPHSHNLKIYLIRITTILSRICLLASRSMVLGNKVQEESLLDLRVTDWHHSPIIHCRYSQINAPDPHSHSVVHEGPEVIHLRDDSKNRAQVHGICIAFSPNFSCRCFFQVGTMSQHSYSRLRRNRYNRFHSWHFLNLRTSIIVCET
jgi:hypothetical protein